MTESVKERINVFWFLPTHGDGRYLGTAQGGRPVDLPYLQQVALAADNLGYYGVLIPTGKSCEDSWLVAAALAPITRRLRYLVAVRPGLQPPSLAARMAATLDRLSDGRLLINVVTGGDPVEQRRFGDFLDHDQRYARTGEFLEVLRGVSKPAHEPGEFDYDGRHYRIEAARIDFGGYELPQIFFGGASAAAEQVAPRHVDTYLTWGEPPSVVEERVRRVRDLAASHGRTVSFGIRLHVISRDTEAQAWAEADRLIERITPERVAKAQAVFARTESTGQQRMTQLQEGSGIAAVTSRNARALEVSPGLWAGYGLVRGGAGTALVGSHEQVADLIGEYHELGFDHFILSGQPHVEEAYHFAEGAAAVLRARRLIAQTHG
jgi:alkanesulfonate monooxygenase